MKKLKYLFLKILLHRQIHIFVVIFAFVSCFFPNIFPLVLFKSFALQMSIGLFFMSLIFLFIRRLSLASLYFFTSVSIFSTVYSFVFRQKLSGDAVDFSLAHFNVLYLNKNYAQMQNTILESGADMVSLQEVDRKWAENLEKTLPKTYPYYLIKIDGKNSGGGMAIFSKIPFEQLDTLRFDELPYLFGKIKVKNKMLSFLVAHTYSPSNYYYFVRRNRQFVVIRDFLSKKQKPLLFIGDLNAVSWDDEILKTEKALGLQDSRFGFEATFPAFASSFGIPIDYIFHSENIACLGFRTIKTDSDHLGIFGYYKISD